MIIPTTKGEEQASAAAHVTRSRNTRNALLGRSCHQTEMNPFKQTSESLYSQSILTVSFPTPCFRYIRSERSTRQRLLDTMFHRNWLVPLILWFWGKLYTAVPMFSLVMMDIGFSRFALLLISLTCSRPQVMPNPCWNHLLVPRGLTGRVPPRFKPANQPLQLSLQLPLIPENRRLHPIRQHPRLRKASLLPLV